MEESRQNMQEIIVPIWYDNKKKQTLLKFKPMTTGILVDLRNAMPDMYKEYIIFLPDSDYGNRYEPTLFASEHQFVKLTDILEDKKRYHNMTGTIVTEHKGKYLQDPNDTWIMQNYCMRAVLVIPGMETPKNICIPPGNAKPKESFSGDSLEATVFNLTKLSYRNSRLNGPLYAGIREMLNTL